MEVIVGAILTQNTAWTNVEKAVKNLKKAKALSSIQALKKINRKKLAALIKPSGYYNIKTKRLKHLVSFLDGAYGGNLNRFASVPTGKLRGELLEVNGIGPETCDSILLYAFNRPVFVIDAYTRRIFSRHGFCREDVSYDELQGLFMKNVPPDRTLYNEYHALIVRLAKDFCRKRPGCKGCPLKTKFGLHMGA